MPYVAPSNVVANELVDEDDWNVLVDDIVYLAANLIPVGAMLDYGAATAPSGYLLCDGTAVDRTTYASLFAIIGVLYGSGNGTTTFNVPDFRQRVAIGKAASGTASTLGSTGGTKDAINVSHSHSHSHTVSQDAHSHTINAHTHGFTTSTDGSHVHSVGGTTGFVIGFRTDAAANGHVSGGLERETYSNIDAGGSHNHTGTTGSGGNNSNSTTATNQTSSTNASSSGSSGTDQNLPPYVVITKIIKY